MKKRFLIIGSTLATALLSLVLVVDGQAPAAGQSENALTGNAAERKAFIDQYCIGCHSTAARNAGMESGRKLILDTVDIANMGEDAEVWERVVRKVRAGMMPPSGLPRPSRENFEKWMVSMENALDASIEEKLPPPGLHRMNRTEYANVIDDLLGLKINPSLFLPSDDSTRGFDNIAGALTISPALMEGYISAAGKISRLALGNINTAVQSTYRVPEDTTQDYHIEGMPFGTRGGLIVEHEFPADGQYKMQITPISKGNMGSNNPFGEIPDEKLEVVLDGERLHLFDWDGDRERSDGTYNFEFEATAGRHTVAVTFLATNYAPGNDLNEHFLRSTLETGGLPGFRFFPHVGKFVIDGPYNSQGASDTEARRRLFVCQPASQGEEAACAREIVSNIARRAYRRPVTDQDMEILMGFYQQGRNEGSFDNGIEYALRRVLADPQFVFRKEAEPANLADGETYRISDLELASRLSFFIWSSIPDDELLSIATEGRLRQPGVLETQVRRMLADPRSERLVQNFAGQWLGLRALRAQVPVANLFPDFDDNLRIAMDNELTMFVNYVMQNDRPVTELLDANYTFLNERLAKHYGIPNIYGSNMRYVELPPEFDIRRGIIGTGSFQTVSSVPERNSPVNRGKYVLQMFLGVDPPAPPPGVEVDLASAGRDGQANPTIRQQMELHRKNEPCLSCHKIMDPIGLSLENFNAIGAWRLYEEGVPIDPTGVLVDGTPLAGINDLRNALVTYSPQFVRLVAEKLMIYALGRGTEYYDMPTIREIVHNAEANDYRFSTLVLGVVESDAFQMNQKLQSLENGEANEVRAAR